MKSVFRAVASSCSKSALNAVRSSNAISRLTTASAQNAIAAATSVSNKSSARLFSSTASVNSAKQNTTRTTTTTQQQQQTSFRMFNNSNSMRASYAPAFASSQFTAPYGFSSEGIAADLIGDNNVKRSLSAMSLLMLFLPVDDGV
eukprot:GEZU01011224.1.p1 GENE.GEZU01011224.1~~GEZU01011224.1.p1  ORF type:complete len:145 (-),score=17.69 GEZU01011224.1:151-585(-)